MKGEVLERYTDGHHLTDNGVGDYDLHCTDGAKVQFVPFMLSGMVPGSICRRCKKEIIQ